MFLQVHRQEVVRFQAVHIPLIQQVPQPDLKDRIIQDNLGTSTQDPVLDLMHPQISIPHTQPVQVNT